MNRYSVPILSPDDRKSLNNKVILLIALVGPVLFYDFINHSNNWILVTVIIYLASVILFWYLNAAAYVARGLTARITGVYIGVASNISKKDLERYKVLSTVNKPKGMRIGSFIQRKFFATVVFYILWSFMATCSIIPVTELGMYIRSCYL